MATAATLPLYGQTDTIVHLSEVSATARRTSQASAYTIGAATLRQSAATHISDALKMLPGVSIKDYGGLGGIKSISVRGIGSQHTAVSVDGAASSNTQTGTIDLGIFPIQTIGSMTLSNGQSDDMLQCARLMAASNVVEMTSRAITDTAIVGCSAGSFGTVSLWGEVATKQQRHAARLSATFDHSDGNYPFRLACGNITTRQHRQNGQINQLRLTADHKWQGAADVQSRIFALISNRGLPKATTYYNLHSRESLLDRRLEAQTTAKLHGNRSALRAIGKYTIARQSYRNPDALGTATAGSRYLQQEAYGSLSAMHAICESVMLSAAADIGASALASGNVEGTPRRLSAHMGATAKYRAGIATTKLSAVAICHADRHGGRYTRIAPTASVSIDVSQGITVRAFAKSTCRMPTFNDLYYNGIGNRRLKPEEAMQYNIGGEARTSIGLLSLCLSADAYHNEVSNKIVAIPTKNIFIWSMQNIGRARIRGVAATGDASYAFAHGYKATAWVSYSYQHATDRTDASQRCYGHQLPYMPRFGGTVLITLDTPWAKCGYTANYQGRRYALSENIADNAMPAYTEHSLTISKSIKLGCRTATEITAELHNITDSSYEVVRNFPMPGRRINIKCTIAI